MMPVWIAVLGRVVLHERLPRLAVIGIVVGFVGVAILVGPTALGATGALDAAGVVALIISPIAWSSGSLFATHRAELPRHPLVSTGLQMVTGALVLATMSIVSGEPARFDPSAVTRPVIRRVRLPHDRGQHRRVHDVRLDDPGGAPAAGRDVRVRQPGRRGDPRCDHPRRADRAAHRARRWGDRRGGRADRDRPRPHGAPAAGRRPYDSASTVRATRRASAITVSIGLTPMAVGKSDASAT